MSYSKDSTPGGGGLKAVRTKDVTLVCAKITYDFVPSRVCCNFSHKLSLYTFLRVRGDLQNKSCD